MSFIVEIEEDEMFRLYNYYHKACFPHWKGGDIHEVEGIEERHKCWECQEWIEAEQEMQALDEQINQEEEEEFGEPNAEYCNSLEPDHNGGWFCHHPDCVTGPDEMTACAETTIECECGNPLVFGHECSLGYWNGRQYLVTAKTRQR